MPSTYSPALRIELIGNGEQAANWGNTTNTNLGTLIEQAITGVSSIVMPDSNYTLISGNGVADQARNAVLVMTGFLTAPRDVIVPSSNKLYIVRNATTGGQNITVRTASGFGSALINGFTQIVYCDGTNVLTASPPFNSSNNNMAIGGNVVVGGNLSVDGGVFIDGVAVVPPGTIVEYGGGTAPFGWLLCDGAAVSRATYADLFAALGTTYGAGDGSTTFNVPNRINRFGVGAGGLYARGSTGGSATETTSSAGAHDHTGFVTPTAITAAQMPSHTHTGTTSTNGDHAHGVPGFFGGAGAGPNASLDPINANFSTTVAGAHNHTFTTNATGGGDAHSHAIVNQPAHTHTVTTIPPYVASNYIIKT